MERNAPMPDLRPLLDLAISASLEAGKAILEVYASEFAVTCKEDRSPLTLADKRSHEIIARQLTGASGRYPLLSEEGRSIPFTERRQWDLFWLVDPLDGTKEFIKRNGEFTVNIALIRHGVPVLGVIYIPVTDVLYYAADGMGAWKVERAATGLKVEQALRLPLASSAARPVTAIASRSHLSPETEAFLGELRQEHGQIEIVSAGSSLKFCLIAEGKADVYPRFAPTMEWDTAAGQAIVREAGGSVVRKEDGQNMIYNKQDLLNPWFIANASSAVKGPS